MTEDSLRRWFLFGLNKEACVYLKLGNWNKRAGHRKRKNYQATSWIVSTGVQVHITASLHWFLYYLNSFLNTTQWQSTKGSQPVQNLECCLFRAKFHPKLHLVQAQWNQWDYSRYPDKTSKCKLSKAIKRIIKTTLNCDCISFRWIHFRNFITDVLVIVGTDKYIDIITPLTF